MRSNILKVARGTEVATNKDPEVSVGSSDDGSNTSSSNKNMGLDAARGVIKRRPLCGKSKRTSYEYLVDWGGDESCGKEVWVQKCEMTEKLREFTKSFAKPQT
jgi:hypothetical protein